ERIKNLVGEGETENAINEFLQLPHLDREIRLTAFLLRNRWNALERDAAAGVADRRELNLEQARMVRGLLDLLEQWEEVQTGKKGGLKGDPTVSTTNETPSVQQKATKKSWLWIGLPVIILLGLLAGYLIYSNSGRILEAEEQNFRLQIASTSNEAPFPTGVLAIVVDGEPLVSEAISENQSSVEFSLPSERILDTTMIDLSRLSHGYKMREIEFATNNTGLTIANLQLAPIFSSYSGRVIYNDGEGVSKVRIVFKDLAEDITDAEGRYTVSFPKPNEQRRVVVELYQNQEQVLSKSLLLDPEVLKELKIKR
ncbi:MAG: hypothetical protein AAFQ37_15225, partial [Bacteroidota bacterium]